MLLFRQAAAKDYSQMHNNFLGLTSLFIFILLSGDIEYEESILVLSYGLEKMKEVFCPDYYRLTIIVSELKILYSLLCVFPHS